MSGLQLRPYQSKLVDDIRESYAVGNRAPLVCLPTGGGKTTIFAYVTASAAAKGRCVYLIAHRAELVKQIAGTLARFGCTHRIVAPEPVVRQVQVEQFKALGRTYVHPQARVFVCSVQTLVKRLDKYPKPDLIVVDESHHLVEGNTWGNVLTAFPSARVLPVTATPCRTDGRGLGAGAGGFADDLVMGPSMAELIEGGFLSPYRVFAPPTALDLAGVKSRAGDYAKEQLATAMDKPTITGSAVEHYKKLTPNRRAVVFCVSVAHAEHVAAEFIAAGITAASLDGTMEAAERDGVIKRFSSGETLILTSADLVSEGFDLPAIEVAILLRPTQSLSLYLQQVGRALRTFAGKREAVILDHVGAVVTHGLPDEPREWSLDGEQKRERKAANDNEPEVKIRTCTKCFTVHVPAPVCPCCGHEYPVAERKVAQTEGVLQEITADQMDALRRQKRLMQGQAQSVDQLVAQGIGRFRAMKIVEAREQKARLREQVRDARPDIPMRSLLAMKPAELRAALAV